MSDFPEELWRGQRVRLPAPWGQGIVSLLPDAQGKVAYCNDADLEHTCEVGEPDLEFDLGGRQTCTVANGEVVPVPVGDASVVSSRVAQKTITRRPVIDLDVPVRLVPSTTPGHSHLYVDHTMTHSQEIALLEGMVAAGIVEEGILMAARARGATQVRLPWVKKKERDKNE